VFFPLVPFLIVSKEAQKTDYLNKEFKDVVLNRDASAHGFVYYTFTYGTPTKSKLVLRFVDETDGTSFVVRVPLIE
jgi:hypothetical protein